MSLLDTASLVVTPNGTKASKLYSVVPSDGAGDLSVTRATSATRVNSAGLIESVASNVPRLDYTNGTCPSILVEPQRTNLALYSEDLNNANWNKVNNITVDSNASVAPDGNTTADRLNAIETISVLRQFVNVSLGQTVTFSCYIKKSTGSPTIKIRIEDQLIPYGNSNIDFVATNTWQKISVTRTVGLGVTQVSIDIFPDINSNGSVFIWGAQLEAGSYATSYIPTTSASVTRNADQIYKTGISSLIGQTEGTLFIDFYHDGLLNYFPCSISNGLYNDAIYFEQYLGNMQFVIFDNGNFQTAFNAGALSIGRHKMAVGYKTNDTVFYIDGVLKYTDTSLTVPDCSRFDIGFVGGVSIDKTQTNLTALWKTRLTNTQLAQLTTI
jgi:hypothetical protein